MQINGIIVPDAGTTTVFIADPIGGWMYEAETVITVIQTRLDQFQAKIDQAKQARDAAQAIVDTLEQAASTVSNQNVPIDPQENQASSTPESM